MIEVTRFAGLCLAGFIFSVGIAGADSLFSKKVAERGTLVSDEVAKFKEGDLITVLVRESIDARTTSDTDTKKEADVQASAPPLANPFLVAQGRQPGEGGLNLLNPEELPNWEIGIENEHKTAGKTARANRLVMTVGCVVTKVHENGNVEIAGEKRVTVNSEDSTLLVKGVIRGRDVTAANTIGSNQIADAEIELKGKGPLWNNQRRGLMTKLLDWFSPF